MPGTPCYNSNEVSKDLQPKDPQNLQRNEPPAPVHEITQTDRLNKRLLVSFLQRMNSQETRDNQQSTSKNDENDNDDNSDDSFE
ncbi:uncharacterized protein LOC131670054 [Phymastichus coffea]|uniref:uncharacterized protein LOC131670054 n=1 Tax=Phymastichus coffea TaxID=108790 RepID=UPI00273C96DF|nr:uncharacterized protein LOC131670054 [Phymastichus coffea]